MENHMRLSQYLCNALAVIVLVILAMYIGANGQPVPPLVIAGAVALGLWDSP
jgi:hypothetical protein